MGYEVYIRSFADSDADGVGDLDGLHDRLDYLAWLGVDLVWITPCFPSPLADHGYDVADYLRVADELGGTRALERVVERAHALGIAVLLDLVPNHTSSAHPWFVASRTSRDDPKRDWYIWRDPAPDGGPPNNWLSHFGGPAWTYDAATGQYYCHLFLPEQPDLNWANPEVAAAFEDIIAYWLDRGIDGFRIDVAHALAKHADLPDLPPARAGGAGKTLDLVRDFEALQHVYDVNQPEVLDVYRAWRGVADARDGLLLGEVYLTNVDDLAPFVASQDGLHLAFWFAPLRFDGRDPAPLRRWLIEGTGLTPGCLAWITSSHDSPRAASRLGGGQRGRDLALAVAVLQFGLPGLPLLYQGEELALVDVDVPPDAAEDPIAVRAGAYDHSRDRCRTPMPWQAGPGLGFTTAQRAWLPFGERAPEDTVEVQRCDPDSFLHRYRALVALRHDHADLSSLETGVEWQQAQGPVIAYRRGSLLVAANLGQDPVAWDPGQQGRVVFSTDRRREGATVAGPIELAPAAALAIDAG